MPKIYDDGILRYRLCNRHQGLEVYSVMPVGELAGKIEIPDYINTIPVVSIAEKTFSDCKHLEEVIIGAKMLEIRNLAFVKTPIKKVTQSPMGHPVKIGFRAFAGCRQLEEFDVKISELGGECFRDCFSLESLRISGNCSKVADYAFSGCNHLDDLAFESNPFATLELFPLAFEAARIERLYIMRNVSFNNQNLLALRSPIDYFHPATKIYCPDWSNLKDLCFMGRDIVIQENCI